MASPQREAAYALEEMESDLVPVRSADRCGKGRWRWWVALASVVILVTIISAIGFKTYAPDVPPPPAVFLCRTAQGLWDNGLAVFRGIPFGVAERWELPKFAPCWTGTFDGSKHGVECPQMVATGGSVKESEQCLNIDVWTANLHASRKPVPIIFFLHGGSNVMGNNEAYANLGLFAQSNRVCVFAPNYRLGVFGFLGLKELSALDPRNSSGNYGVEDIRLALRWTKDYASKFGCDANKITLMGQSSGATNIFALLSNPENTGLFHGAIALSGSPNITQSLEATEIQGRAVVTNAKCEVPDVLGCLRNLSLDALRKAMPSQWGSTTFWPTDPKGLANPGLVSVDGVTVRTDFTTAMTSSMVDVPLLLQTARADLVLFPLKEVPTMNASDFREALRDNFKGWPNNETGRFLADAYNSSATGDVLRAWGELTTDMMMYCAHVELASRALQPRTRHSPIYVSVVDQPPAKNLSFVLTDGTIFRVTEPCHAWDYMVAARAWSQILTVITKPYEPGPPDESLGNLFRTQWLDFATGSLDSKQAPFDSGDFPSSFVVNVQGDTKFSSTSRAVPNYRSSFCQLLKDVDLNPDSRFWLVN